MKSVLEILEAHGISDPHDMRVGDHIEIKPDTGAQMPLVIEKIREDEHGTRLSVAHYYTQMGDLMADPEIVFDVDHADKWVPVRYVQHPHIEQYDPHGLGKSVTDFVKRWDKNLRKQGYIRAAETEVAAQ